MITVMTKAGPGGNTPTRTIYTQDRYEAFKNHAYLYWALGRGLIFRIASRKNHPQKINKP